MARRYKCPYCEDRYERAKLVSHIDKKHYGRIKQLHGNLEKVILKIDLLIQV